MDATAILIWLIIGGVAGWLAGNLMGGGGFGLFGNVLVGIIGAVLGGFVFGLFGWGAGNIVGSLIVATLGSMLLLLLVGLIQPAR